MSTSLILGGAGAAVGGYFGGPVGAQAGFAAGYAIGGAIDGPPEQVIEGPRLSDLGVSGAAYGTGIADIYGTIRVPAQLISSGPKEEVEHESDVGGGKNQPKTTQTSYTYQADVRWMFGEGVGNAVRRIFIDKKIAWSAAGDATADEIAASSEFPGEVRVYLGAANQDVDPTEEARIGVGQVSAYRGLITIFIENWDLGPNGRVPNVEAEVVRCPGITVGEEINTDTFLTQRVTYPMPFDGSTGGNTRNGGIAYIAKAENGVITWSSSGTFVTQDDVNAGDFSRTMWLVDTDYTGTEIERRGYTRTDERDWNINAPVRNADRIWSGWFRDVNTNQATLHWFYDYKLDPLVPIPPFTGNLLTRAILSIGGSPLNSDFPINTGYEMWRSTRYGDHIYGIPGHQPRNFGNEHIFRWPMDEDNPAIPSGRANASWHAGQTIHGHFINDDGVYYMISGGAINPSVADEVVLLDHALTTEIARWPLDFSAAGQTQEVNNQWGELMVKGDLVILGAGSRNHWYSFKLPAGGSATRLPLYQHAVGQAGPFIGSQSIVSFVADDTWLVVVGQFVGCPGVDKCSVPLSTIVAARCAKNNLPADKIDVSELPDPVLGYVIPRPMSGRSAIEPLMPAFQFYAVESEGIVKFPKRGKAPVATIPTRDLGAHEFGSETPDLVTIEHTQDLELPRNLNVSYLDVDNDDQVAIQPAPRIDNQSLHTENIELPLVLTASKARQVAEIISQGQWGLRNRVLFSLGLKYVYLDPGDSVNIELPNRTITVLIRGMTVAPPGLIQCEGSLENTDYISDAEATAPEMNIVKLVLAGPTIVEFLDIPMLRDADDSPGYYVAIAGTAEGWPGGVLNQSTDGGTSYTQLITAVGKATIGTAETALPDAEPFVFDRVNSVDITLRSGDVFSQTEAQALAATKAGLLGDEIFTWVDVEQIATNRVRLSTLVRGLRGTEWATGSHQINERFVLLDPATIRSVTQNNADVGQERLYKPTTFGQLLQQVQTKTFTNTNRRQMPFAPGSFVASQANPGDDIVATWVRRSRFSSGAFQTPPLGEPTEAYELDIEKAGAVLRTLTATTPTATYTIADMATDGVVAADVLTLRNYQMRGTVRGFAAEITYTVT